jgi:hypothetical protein
MAKTATSKPPIPHGRLVQQLNGIQQAVDFCLTRMPKGIQRQMTGFQGVSNWLRDNAQLYTGQQQAGGTTAGRKTRAAGASTGGSGETGTATTGRRGRPPGAKGRKQVTVHA